MYLFFITGYCLYLYYKASYIKLIKYWPYVLATYVFSFALYYLAPYEPNTFIMNYHKHTVSEILIVNSFKVVLAYSGCYLLLLSLYMIMPYFKGTSLERHIITYGQHTLELYLLQVIFLEVIGGRFYRVFVKMTGCNFIYAYGFLFEFLSTFLITCIVMNLLIIANNLINKIPLLTKLLFYRDVNLP